jgi:regulator of protease activity HflC (stomatin/prohibitin superfamily)
VYKLSTQTEAVEEEASVPSSEGLILTLKTTLLYHLDGACAPKVFRDIGPAYEQKVAEPVFRASVREATASHPANALYSSERESVGKQMTSDISRQLASQCFTVEGVLLKDVALPQTVQDAIEKKQQADQEAQAMEFRLQKERQEAERKRIEAQGIKDFQTIVSQGISEPLLRWKGIEATENLAKSPNAKVVIVGGKVGLPVILGNQ